MRKIIIIEDAGANPDTIQNGTGQSSGEWLKDYEDYGVFYNSQDGCWYCDGDYTTEEN